VNGYSIRRFSEQVRVRESEVQIAEGAFDLFIGFSAARSQDRRLHTEAEREVLNVPTSQSGLTTYRLGVSRRFRSGLLISPGVELTRQDAFTFRAAPIVQTRASLHFTYPFLRGGRRSQESVAIDAAAVVVEASELQLHDIRARIIYQAASAYWSYHGAHRAVDILSDSEEKSRRLLEETATLVAVDERPSSDLDQLRADLADRVAARLGAEQALFEARQQLGLVMGLGSQDAAAIPAPGTALPASHFDLEIPDFRHLTRIALAERADLAGARQNAVAADLVLDARRTAARPGFDLRLDVGYSGLSEGSLQLGQYLPPYGQNDVNGGSATLSLVFDFPAANNSARGALARQEAVLRQSHLSVAELELTITSNILVAAGQLRSSAAELEQADEAVHLYEMALDNERKKLQLGMSTQFELILVDERLRNAMLSRVSAHVRFAQALARLRYETGTLLPVGTDVTAFDPVPLLMTPVDMLE
jgi:outer membrane protein TolC